MADHRLVRTTSHLLLAAGLLAPLLAPMGSAAAKTTISYMGWTTCAEDVAVYKKLFTVFEKDHPDIKIKNLNLAWLGDEGWLAKLLTMTAANVAPDVIAMPFLLMPRLSEAGVLTDLGPYFSRDKSVKYSDWNDAGLESCRWKGKTYGVPWAGSDWWITYNKRLFAEAGVQDPEKSYEQGNWDWTTMEEAAVKLGKFNGTKCTRIGLLQMSDVSSMSPWLMGMGSNILNAEDEKCILDSAAAEGALTHVLDLLYVKKAMGFAWSTPNGFPLDTGVKQQQFGMAAWWNSVISFFTSQKTNFPFNQIPFPAGPVSKYNNLAQFHGVTISKQSKQKDAAWQLAKFLGSKEAATILAKDVQWLTTRKDSVQAFSDILVGQGYTGNKYIADAQARMKLSSRSVRYGTVWPKIDAQLTKGWNRAANMSQAVKAAAREANAELARGKK